MSVNGLKNELFLFVSLPNHTKAIFFTGKSMPVANTEPQHPSYIQTVSTKAKN